MFRGQLCMLSAFHIFPVTLSTMNALKFCPFFRWGKQVIERLNSSPQVTGVTGREAGVSHSTTPSVFCQQNALPGRHTEMWVPGTWSQLCTWPVGLSPSCTPSCVADETIFMPPACCEIWDSSHFIFQGHSLNPNGSLGGDKYQAWTSVLDRGQDQLTSLPVAWPLLAVAPPQGYLPLNSVLLALTPDS